MASNFRVLIVDDDPITIKLMLRILQHEFDVTSANGPVEALLHLRDRGPFHLVISDLRMPGMEGMTLLGHIRRLFPDIIRVVVTGKADANDLITALNDELVFRFLVKPFTPSTLRQAVSAGRGQSELIRAQKDLMEHTWRGTVSALLDVLALFNPVAFGRGDRMARMAEEWATELKVPDPWVIGTTCRLLQLGTAGIPHEVLERLEAGEPLGNIDFKELARMPAIAERILSTIPRLEPIREILTALRALTSPDNISATIVRLAIDVDYWRTRTKTLNDALLQVQVRQGNYPEELLQVAREQLRDASRPGRVTEVRLSDVQIGMTFDAEVRSPHGLLLAARGQKVNASILERIRNQWLPFASEQKVLVELE